MDVNFVDLSPPSPSRIKTTIFIGISIMRLANAYFRICIKTIASTTNLQVYLQKLLSIFLIATATGGMWAKHRFKQSMEQFKASITVLQLSCALALWHCMFQCSRCFSAILVVLWCLWDGAFMERKSKIEKPTKNRLPLAGLILIYSSYRQRAHLCQEIFTLSLRL